ncbi:MAG: CBS domain-containing protein [Deltaproteobacteria bacterium]|nr:CBS domain-containing protein [Deltaproteobacteria bacterium]
MKVRELMKRRVFSVNESDDLALATQLMAWADVRHLPVLHKDGRLVGILTERDVFHYLSREEGRDGLKDPVTAAMRAPVKVAHPEDDAVEAAGRMAQEKIGCLPVLEEGRLVGILTVTDVVADRVRTAFEPRPTDASQVGTVMSLKPASCSPDDYLLDAVARMSAYHVRHLPVVDGDHRVVGLLADRDVRTAIGDPRRTLGRESEATARVQLLRVSDVMTREVVTVQENDPLPRAVDFFLSRRFGALPVVNEEKILVGMLSYLDVLRKLATR